ncbi:MAG: YdeI/OmpD-associated family protein [Solirubrobacteraceae bacterium]
MRFRTTLLLHGKSATGIEVPPEVVESFGAGKKPPVRVTINGHSYQSTVAPRGDVFLVGVSAANREAAGVAAGDEIDVDIEHDASPRTVEVPQDLREALDAAGVGERFDALAYSHRKQHVLAVQDAKTEATRQRRIAKAVEMLQAG